MNTRLAALLFATLGATSVGVGATPIVFSASGTAAGVPVSASAQFEFSGNTLTITLTNTSPANDQQDVPGSTLTGLFWNLAGDPSLAPVSATIAAGSLIQMNKCHPGPCTSSTTNVGGEFGYVPNVAGANYGVASSGYIGLSSGNFGGDNLDDPAALDGINFGIVSAAPGFNPNGGLKKEPLIVDHVVFTLTGVSRLNERSVSNVSFQYGTELVELNLQGECTGNCRVPPTGHDIRVVPEPASLACVALGLVALAWRSRRPGERHRSI